MMQSRLAYRNTNAASGGSSPNGSARSTQLPRYYEAIAATLGCAYLNSQDIVQTSPIDGIHLEASEHAKLAPAIAAKIREM